MQLADDLSCDHGEAAKAIGLVELPESERGPVLHAFFAQVRGGVRFFDADDPEAVVAAAGRYPVFRVEAST